MSFFLAGDGVLEVPWPCVQFLRILRILRCQERLLDFLSSPADPEWEPGSRSRAKSLVYYTYIAYIFVIHVFREI